MANMIALPFLNNHFSKSQKLSETLQQLFKASISSKETVTSTSKERPDTEKGYKCKICGCDPCSCRHEANEEHNRQARYGALVSCRKCGCIPCRCPYISSPKVVRNFNSAVIGIDLKTVACSKCGCAPCKCLSDAFLRELGTFANNVRYISTNCGARCCKCGCAPCRCATASSDLPVVQSRNVCSKCGCTPCRCISMAVICDLGMEKVLGTRYMSTSAAKACPRCGFTPCRCGLALSVDSKSGMCCKCGCTPCKCCSAVLLRESRVEPHVVRYMSSDSIRACCECGSSPCRCAFSMCDGSAQSKGNVCSYCGGYGPCNCGAHSGPCCKCGCQPCNCGNDAIRSSNVCPKCGKNPCVCEKDKIWSSNADVGSPALVVADSRNNNC